MPYIDIDLDDLDFDDLLEEVIYRVDSDNIYTEKERKLLHKLSKKLGVNVNMGKPDNLKDEMKMEYLGELASRYTEEQLRQMEADFKN